MQTRHELITLIKNFWCQVHPFFRLSTEKLVDVKKTSTGKPVAMFSHERKSSREFHSEKNGDFANIKTFGNFSRNKQIEHLKENRKLRLSSLRQVETTSSANRKNLGPTVWGGRGDRHPQRAAPGHERACPRN